MQSIAIAAAAIKKYTTTFETCQHVHNRLPINLGEDGGVEEEESLVSEVCACVPAAITLLTQ